MGEQEPHFSQDEMRLEAEQTRRLAQELAAMDGERRPTSSHYQEASDTLKRRPHNTLRDPEQTTSS